VKKWQILLSVVFFAVTIHFFWTAAYLIVFYFHHPLGTPVLWEDYCKGSVVNAVASAVLFIVMLIFSPWKRGMRILALFTDAMKRIAEGDFNVKLDRRQVKGGGEFGILAASLNEMAQDLGRMEEMRQEFISNVSHEIQSPLTSIGGFARALRDEGLTPEERGHYLDIIETESARMSKLSDNLLKLASLESRRHPFEPRSYRLDKQLRNLVLACEPLWREKEIGMGVSLAETAIEADEDLLSQVWINLIHNAVKFTPEHGGVEIGLRLAGGEAEVTIADSGIGISEEARERVFERFYKEDKSRTRTAGGSGLGLSIVKKIVELHKGTIRVESLPGAGATFIVKLPLSQSGDLK
jgi:two-component system, OmpR family, phosphate regulon sensor histidine kinase PhoR